MRTVNTSIRVLLVLLLSLSPAMLHTASACACSNMGQLCSPTFCGSHDDLSPCYNTHCSDECICVPNAIVIKLGKCPKKVNADTGLVAYEQLDLVKDTEGLTGDFWAPQTMYSISAKGTQNSYALENENDWGQDVDTFTFDYLALSFALSPGASSGERTITVASFAATIPSFQHSSGEKTGLNVLSLRKGFQNTGQVDTTTGAYHLALYLGLENQFYAAGDEVPVYVDVSGTIDASRNKASATFSGMAYKE